MPMPLLNVAQQSVLFIVQEIYKQVRIIFTLFICMLTLNKLEMAIGIMPGENQNTQYDNFPSLWCHVQIHKICLIFSSAVNFVFYLHVLHVIIKNFDDWYFLNLVILFFLFNSWLYSRSFQWGKTISFRIKSLLKQAVHAQNYSKYGFNRYSVKMAAIKVANHVYCIICKNESPISIVTSNFYYSFHK